MERSKRAALKIRKKGPGDRSGRRRDVSDVDDASAEVGEEQRATVEANLGNLLDRLLYEGDPAPLCLPHRRSCLPCLRQGGLDPLSTRVQLHPQSGIADRALPIRPRQTRMDRRQGVEIWGALLARCSRTGINAWRDQPALLRVRRIAIRERLRATSKPQSAGRPAIAPPVARTCSVLHELDRTTRIRASRLLGGGDLA